MKTAMQFLKDEIESKIIPSSKENGELSEYQYGHNIAYSVVLTLAEYLLEKEKDQIVKAVEDTRSNIVPKMFINENLSGEEYYYDLYNQSIKKITITEYNQNK